MEIGPMGAGLITAGVGAGMSLYGAHKDRKRDRANRRMIESGYNQAADITRGGFRGARDIYSQTTPKVSNEIKSGFGRAGQQIGAGYGQGKEEVSGGYDAAKKRLAGGMNQTAGQEIYSRLLGQGGLDPNTVANMKTSASEDYGSAARDIVQQSNPYAGGAGKQGLTAEQMTGGFSRIARDRAETMRDIDTENAMLAEQQQTEAIGQTQERERYMAEMDITQGGTLANMSVEEAVRQGALTTEQSQILAQIEADYGVNMANLTLGEAEALAQNIIGKTGALVGQNQRPNVWGQIGSSLLSGGAQGFGAAAGAATFKG